MALTKKQQAFVQEYLIDLNATQAAIRAGYSARNADQVGPRLVGKSRIAEAIQAAMAERSQRTGIHADRVLAELGRIALFDPRKLFNDTDGLKPIRDLDDDTAACIASIESLEEFEGSGEDRVHVGHTKKIKAWDKVAALRQLMQHLGLLKDAPATPTTVNQINIYLPAKDKDADPN